MESIKCPSCGANVNINNPGIAMAACPYCKSTIYRDAADILKAGVQALVPTNDSRFWLGASGTIRQIPFTVIGRMHFEYAQGGWDEWFIRYDHDFAWIGEDGRNLSLRQNTDIGAAPAQMPVLGQQFTVNDDIFYTREVDRAVCKGFEGELPWAVIPGEQMAYADAANGDGTKFAILSQNERGQKRFTIGDVIGHDDLVFTNKQNEFAQEAPEGFSLQCASCGAAMPPPIIEDAQTVVCPACGSIHDLADGGQKITGRVDRQISKKFIIPLGQEGTFNNTAYQVCGRQYITYDEGGSACLYLLFNPQKGYRYLEYEEGHYTLLEQTHKSPDSGEAKSWFRLDEGDHIKISGQSYMVDCNGTATIKYVDGAFPWQATVGDKSQYVDAWNGNTFYGLEKSKTEIEFYTGPKIGRKAVFSAFGIEQPAAPAGNFKEDEDTKGIARGCILALLATILMPAIPIFLVYSINVWLMAPTPQEAGKIALDNIQKANSAFERDMENPWAKAKEYNYFTQDIVNSYDNQLTKLSTLYDATTDAAKEIKEILAANPQDKDRLKAVTKDLEKQLADIRNEEEPLKAAIGQQLSAYGQALAYLDLLSKRQKEMEELAQTAIADYLNPAFTTAMNRWPEQQQTLLQKKEHLEQSKSLTLLTFKNLQNAPYKAATLTTEQVTNLNQSGGEFTSARKIFLEELDSVKADIASLFVAQEDVLSDLLIDDSGSKVIFTAEISTIKLSVVDGGSLGDSFTFNHEKRQRQLTHTEYNALELSLGTTIYGKATGLFDDEANPAPAVPGSYLKQTSVKDDILNSYLDKSLGRICHEPPPAGKNISAWFKTCYPESRYARTNGWAESKYILSGRTYLAKPKSSGHRHSSHSGSRSHGGK